MNDDLGTQIRRMAGNYLEGVNGLQSFNDWLAEVIWNTESDSASLSLAYDIELLISEYSAGHRSRDDFKKALKCAIMQ